MKKLFSLIAISMIVLTSCGAEIPKKDLFSRWEAFQNQSDLTGLPKTFDITHCMNEMKCPSRMQKADGIEGIARFTFTRYLSHENNGSFKILLMENAPDKDSDFIGTYYLENGILILCTDGCKKYY